LGFLLLGQFALPRIINASISVFLQVGNYQEIGEQKIKRLYGSDYQFFRFIQSQIPPESKILLPPNQAPWRHTGNFEINQALLYPRQVASYTGQSLLDFDYIVISSEEEGGNPDDFYTWPNFNVSSQSVIIYNFDNNQFTEYFGDYDYQHWSQSKSWGLIKQK